METKTEIRQRLRSMRLCREPAEVRASGVAVLRALGEFAPYLEAATVLAYVADENEVPTADVIADAAARGKQVWLPRIREVAFAAYRAGTPLTPGTLGIPEPAGPLAGWSPDLPCVALVPLLAWDPYGGRVGRGKGWYDRVLSRLGTGVLRVGLAYEFQACDRLPQEPGDAGLDFIITEARVVPSHRTESGRGRRDQ